jgi:hypothetical protein
MNEGPHNNALELTKTAMGSARPSQLNAVFCEHSKGWCGMRLLSSSSLPKALVVVASLVVEGACGGSPTGSCGFVGCGTLCSQPTASQRWLADFAVAPSQITDVNGTLEATMQASRMRPCRSVNRTPECPAQLLAR